MKNINFLIKAGLAVVIVIVTLLNVNIATNSDTTNSYLSLVNVEALADTEMNNWLDWLDQSLTKDEREVTVECQAGNNTSGVEGYIEVLIDGVPVKVGINVGSSSPAGTSKITCANGSDNCTPTDC